MNSDNNSQNQKPSDFKLNAGSIRYQKINDGTNVISKGIK